MHSPCNCAEPERCLGELKGLANERAITISEKDVNDQFVSATDKAKTVGYAWMVFSGLSVFGGLALAAATAVVSAPIFVFGSVLIYAAERPRLWHRNVSLFLANECLEKDPSATDEQVLAYISLERPKFYGSQCSYCESMLDLSP
jgi:hypothetical protein